MSYSINRPTGTKNDKEEEKPDLSLLPLDLLEGLTRTYEYGMQKYDRNDWRKGFAPHRMISAALRHIMEYNNNEQLFDAEAMEAGKWVYHVDMAIFNLLCVKDAILNGTENKNWGPNGNI